jgi:hypothetical protein
LWTEKFKRLRKEQRDLKKKFERHCEKDSDEADGVTGSDISVDNQPKGDSFKINDALLVVVERKPLPVAHDW